MSQYQQPNAPNPPQQGPGQPPPPGWAPQGYPPQQGPGQPPPPGWAPQAYPPPKKKRTGLKILLGAVAVVFVIAIASSLGGGGDTQGTEAADPAAADPADSQRAAGIGDAVRDGKFEFTVTKIEDGVRKIGPKFLSEKAQGQFVLVHVTVENVGDEAQYLSATDQYLYDQADREHTADDSAWMVMENNPLLEQVNPGNKVDGTLVFDIPEDAKPTRLELHDSAFSDGITVAVK